VAEPERFSEEYVRRVVQAPTNKFSKLLRLGGLDPAQHLRWAEWSGADFRGDDLRGFDFTGARMRGCDFSGARIRGARFAGADLAGSDLSGAKDFADYVRDWRGRGEGVEDRGLRDFEVFRDAPFAPEMVVIPAGEFWMGSADDDPDAYDDEKPRHLVRIARRFAIGRYPVTFAEWDACHAAGGTRHRPKDEDWGRERMPVINVSWHDAEEYIAWLKGVTGKDYRLPSEAEWEYVARGGTETPYWWGGKPDPEKANFDGKVGRTTAVGIYPANPWGLYDVLGNVYEWVADGWHGSYEGAPSEGMVWEGGESSRRVVRGGFWYCNARYLRAAYRGGNVPGDRSFDLGFRLARTLD